MVSQPSETLETDASLEEELTLDPAEERFLRLETSLSTLNASHQRVENQVGYISRQLEKLAAQPPSAARNEEVAALTERLDEFMLNLTTDPEQREAMLQQRLQQARKPVTPPPPQKEPELTPTQQRTLNDIRVEAWHNVLTPQAHQYARSLGLGLGWDDFVVSFNEKFKPLSWGEPARGDPLGQNEIEQGMKTIVKNEVARIKAQQKPRNAIAETTRGIGAGNTTKVTLAELANVDLSKGTKVLKRETEALLDRIAANGLQT